MMDLLIRIGNKVDSGQGPVDEGRTRNHIVYHPLHLPTLWLSSDQKLITVCLRDILPRYIAREVINYIPRILNFIHGLI